MVSMRMALIVAGALALAAPVAAAPAGLAGLYKRPNGETAQVTVEGGKLYCKIMHGVAEGFEMCNGMALANGDSWQGRSMKHPEMPDFMTFTGTVTRTDIGLAVKGCAVGQSMCDLEKWVRMD